MFQSNTFGVSRNKLTAEKNKVNWIRKAVIDHIPQFFTFKKQQYYTQLMIINMRELS